MEAVGSLIDDKFEVISVIGSGGFGSVYKTRQVQFDRIVAVKMFHGLSESQEQLARFEREAQVISLIQHRNIVKFYGYGFWRGRPYIAMEFVEGDSLQTLLAAQGNLEPSDAIDIMKQILEALKCAHANGVVHRDLKPSNVMVTGASGNYSVKVIDFGLAKVQPTVDLEKQKLTQEGATVGSVLYMSPEQCLGQKVDHRSDIYAAGCILQSCLTGLPPFSDQLTFIVMRAHVQEAPRTLLESGPNCSFAPGLQDVLDQALAKLPSNRYATVDQMLHDLEMLSKGRGSELISSRTGTPALSSGVHRRPAKSPGSILVMVASVLALILGAVASYFYFAGKPSVHPVREAWIPLRKKYDREKLSPKQAKDMILALESAVRVSENNPPDAETLLDVRALESSLLQTYNGSLRDIQAYAEKATTLAVQNNLYTKSAFEAAYDATYAQRERNFLIEASALGKKFFDAKCPADALRYKCAMCRVLTRVALDVDDMKQARKYLAFFRDNGPVTCDQDLWLLTGEIALMDGDLKLARANFQKGLDINSPEMDSRFLSGIVRVAEREGNWHDSYEYITRNPTSMPFKMPLNAIQMGHNGQWRQAETAMLIWMDKIDLMPWSYYAWWTNVDVPFFIKLARDAGQNDVAARIEKRYKQMGFIAKVDDGSTLSGIKSFGRTP